MLITLHARGLHINMRAVGSYTKREPIQNAVQFRERKGCSCAVHIQLQENAMRKKE